MRFLNIILSASILLVFGCEKTQSKSGEVVVFSQIKQYSHPDEPQTTGVKFYHILDSSNYESAKVLQIENGRSVSLGSGEVKHYEYITASFHTERSKKSYWGWYFRSSTGQISFYQDYIDEGWRLANASWSRKAKLNGSDAVVDVMIFCKINEDLDIKIFDLAMIKGMTDGTLSNLIETSKEFPQYRFVALTLN